MQVFDETDMFIISFPKCGRTWLRFMLGNALSDRFGVAVEGAAGNFNTFTLKIREAGCSSIRQTSIIHDGSSFTSHRPYHELLNEDKSHYQGKSVLFLVRDPRDVVVSYYFHMLKRENKYEGTLSEFIRDEYLGIRKILAFYKNWHNNRHIPAEFRLLRYEDIHADPLKALKESLEMMQVSGIDEHILIKAVEQGRFDRMQNMEKSGQSRHDILRPGNPDDPESFKVRKGKIGGYKEYLSQTDIDYLNRMMAEMEEPFYLPSSTAMTV